MKRRLPRLRPLSDDERALLEAHLRAHPPPRKRADALPRPPDAALSTLAKRGAVPVDGEIDLHGKTLERAWLALDALLDRGSAAGWRYLRVITGKGLHSAHGEAVLAEAIPARLRTDPRVAEVVRAVKAADGGRGAWFVRLRRA